MLRKILRSLEVTKKEILIISLGCAIMSFGVINIHEQAQITEGGVLGLGLFLRKALNMNLAYTTPILDGLCYILGFSMLGRIFLKKSIIATIMFAVFYWIFDYIGPVIPSLYDMPILAAILGGIFIGCGCGIAVTAGGCAGGDDALAMTISKKTKWPISRAYLFTDYLVLGLSLIYIPFGHLIYSFLTTIISSFLIGQFELKMEMPAWQVCQGKLSHAKS
ncbi:YitT family protein [Anaerococcus jeddahensis]|uniref:YitT family protein n=1 Tax=Anaerococcus jeddahensis TaxID=1673719 RepID=UPI0006726081|nr:YitT family protein [Anaerococcus jeddahensis]